ncbi:ABC transporter substrate-binding protein [Streptomyces rimosus]|uniref:ABC transporter substrate-binding protein n=1 Tax=Streptomyces rimosus TaxID=1927 RepID=UPI000B0F7E7B|nr:ABC transporter substrate-binding protein [Streptomyces rimosus]
MYRLRAAVAATAVLLLSLTACGNDGARSGGDGPDSIEIGALSIVDTAPVHLAVSHGFFAKNGISAKITPVQGGANSAPGVVSGQFDFGFSNTTTLLTAREQGLPLKAVANGVSSTGQAGPGKDYSAILVPKDSSIRSARDLPGHNIAVNQLQNIGDTTIRAAVRKAGGDPGKLRFTEIPLPDMAAALAAGRVDAVWTVEPFQTQTVDQGARAVCWPFAEAVDNLTVAMYFTSEKLLRENPGLVKRFTTAINQALAYARTHPEAVREELGKYTKIPPAVIHRIVLPKWPTEINRASVQTVADLARKDGVLKRPADVGALLP